MPDLLRPFASAALVLTVLAGCGSPAPTPPASGLSQQQAIDAARQFVEVHTGGLAVSSARSGPFGSLGSGVVLQGVPSGRWVWAVTFTGSFPAGCAGASSVPATSVSSPCPSAILTHDVVVIDYADGHLLVSSVSP